MTGENFLPTTELSEVIPCTTTAATTAMCDPCLVTPGTYSLLGEEFVVEPILTRYTCPFVDVSEEHVCVYEREASIFVGEVSDSGCEEIKDTIASVLHKSGVNVTTTACLHEREEAEA